ncbi:hypothetical protein [Xylella fastidiosa]|uniref:hypothetical protein n=1 Tax=Xylella fastidiosa TaxID=2371 RepID=UPI0005832C4D|nr:hypothetical protein [Xylella fastidiosa]AVI20048.1 hypothetical protein BCV75_01050 [Xylella fastidiosa]KIA59041.1 hypothetical protein RA12_01085 [Xylella fastidiosa]KXB18411.1 hypothetical protein ADT31_03170 [Xylella fastidiosa]
MLESAVLFPYFCFLAFVSGVAVLTLFALNEAAISSELWPMQQHFKGYFTALLVMEESADFGCSLGAYLLRAMFSSGMS